MYVGIIVIKKPLFAAETIMPIISVIDLQREAGHVMMFPKLFETHHDRVNSGIEHRLTKANGDPQTY